MQVRFIRPFDYVPSLERRVTIAYPANPKLVRTVKRECGEAAVAAGAAVEIKGEASGTENQTDAAQQSDTE